MILIPDTLRDMFYELVDNAFLVIGTELWQKTIGIQVGTNCAGHVANLHCIMCEIVSLGCKVAKGNYDLAQHLL